MEKILEWDIIIDSIYYPKRPRGVQSGEYSIFSATVKSKNKEGIPHVTIKGNLTCDIERGSKYKVQVKESEIDSEGRESHELIYINRKVNLTTEAGQRGFLSMILPAKTVEELLKTHSNVIELLENGNIKELLKVKGIGQKKAKKIISKYEDTKDLSELYAKIGQFGFTNNLIKKLIDHYGSAKRIIDIFETNPYAFIAVNGIGFKKADAMAFKIGIEPHDPRRIDGCITYILSEAGEKGKSFLNPKQLKTEIQKNIGDIDSKIIRARLDELSKNDKIKLFLDDRRVALTKYFRLEKNIYTELLRLTKGYNPYNKKDDDEYIPSSLECANFQKTIKEIEKDQGYEFNEKQKKAIQLCISYNVLALTGLAGTGKTSTANGISKIYGKRKIMAVALSGKASVRLSEATGIEAKTIHRTLEYNGKTFLRNKDNKLEADVVIIDEATMINGRLFLALLGAIPSGAKVIIMGDVQQLTPIGSCHVFADILNSRVIPSVRLTEIHRQAMRSGIIPTSIRIAQQEQIFSYGYTGNQIVGELLDMEMNIYTKNQEVFNAVIEKFKTEIAKTNNILETQIICPMKNKGILNCYNINTEIQKIVNPVNANNCIDVFCGVTNNESGKAKENRLMYKIGVGDKVINIKNNYLTSDEKGEAIPVYNGNIGTVISIEDDLCIVDFVGIGVIVLSLKEAKSLELAYAITIHKSQGSGFDNVIVAINNETNGLLNNAESLYTAITRAKKYCTLVATTDSVIKSIKSKETVDKQTFLPDFFSEKYIVS